MEVADSTMVIGMMADIGYTVLTADTDLVVVASFIPPYNVAKYTFN